MRSVDLVLTYTFWDQSTSCWFILIKLGGFAICEKICPPCKKSSSPSWARGKSVRQWTRSEPPWILAANFSRRRSCTLTRRFESVRIATKTMCNQNQAILYIDIYIYVYTWIYIYTILFTCTVYHKEYITISKYQACWCAFDVGKFNNIESNMQYVLLCAVPSCQ